MPFLVSLADLRDGVIVVYGILGIIFFLVATLITLVLGLTAKSILGSVKGVINDSVKPTLGSIRETAESIRGTTEFVGQTTVTPIVKTYGFVAGVRRGLSVLGSIGKKRRS